MSIKILDFPRQTTSILNPVKIIKNFSWRYFASISQEKHIFVIGAPRSGTTLIFSVLFAHPAFSAIESETFFFVPRDVFNLSNYTRLTKFGAPSKEEIIALFNQSRDLVEFYDLISYSVKKGDTNKRFLEKTPFHALYIKYLIKHFPNAKFINMIRDGRDCYLSNKRLDSYFYQPLDKFATVWRDSIRLCSQLGNNPQIINVRYEDFTRNPSVIGKQIMSFLGEDFMEQQINPSYFSQGKIFQGASGHERLNQPIKPSSIGKWKKKLSVEEISYFNKLAGSQLTALGYELN